VWQQQQFEAAVDNLRGVIGCNALLIYLESGLFIRGV